MQYAKENTMKYAKENTMKVMNDETLFYNGMWVDLTNPDLVEIWRATGSDPKKDPWSWLELDKNQEQIEIKIEMEGGFFDDYVDMDAYSFICVDSYLAFLYARFIDPDITIDSGGAVGLFCEPNQEGSNVLARLCQTIASAFEEMISKDFTHDAIEEWLKVNAENACYYARSYPEILSHLIRENTETNRP
jgi:hypothetical protein